MISTSSKGERRIIAYGLVARYGPQSVASVKDDYDKKMRSEHSRP